MGLGMQTPTRASVTGKYKIETTAQIPLHRRKCILAQQHQFKVKNEPMHLLYYKNIDASNSSELVASNRCTQLRESGIYSGEGIPP